MNFTVAELCHSDTAIRKGIDNTPDAEALANLDILMAGLERVRKLLGHPMYINSGYRGPKLNAAIGGSKTSAHMKGLAADFVCPGFGPPLEICQLLQAHAEEIRFDQLLLEFGQWVHISFSDVDATPRGEVLTVSRVNGETVYTRGVINA